MLYVLRHTAIRRLVLCFASRNGQKAGEFKLGRGRRIISYGYVILVPMAASVYERDDM